MSATIRQFAPAAMNADTVLSAAGTACRVASQRSTANSVRPMEPKGTRPISTLRPDMRSHSSEPAPMPIEKRASSSVNTCSSPPSTPRVNSGSCAR